MEVVHALGMARMEGLVCLNEAAVAWRGGQLELARELAEQALHCSGSRPGGGLTQGAAILAEALAIRCGRPATSSEIQRLADESLAFDRVPDVSAQALGLLAQVVPGRAEEFRAAARGHAERIPRERWSRRESVLSIDEAIGIENP